MRGYPKLRAHQAPRVSGRPTDPTTVREQWDQACARFVDAVMTDQPDAARLALAEAWVFLSRLNLSQEKP